MTSILCKRPVAFRVPRADPSTAGEMYGVEWRLFQDEQAASEEAEALGVEYQALFNRDGTAIVAEWEPIETAPKDGTKVLVWKPALSTHYGEKKLIAHVDVDVWIEGNWWRSTRYQQPTHWMPLPAPPRIPAVVGGSTPGS